MQKLTRVELQKRKLEIKKLRTSGQTLQAIGDKFGLTRERIRQILKKT